MLIQQTYDNALAQLSDRLAAAQTVTPELMSELIASACVRLPALRRAGTPGRVDRLIEAGAWTDAALALIEAELPQWTLRRLEYDTGAWHCSLSTQRELPAWLDQSADAHHCDPALSILSAFLQARRTAETSKAARPGTVPAVGQGHSVAVCCDNFA